MSTIPTSIPSSNAASLARQAVDETSRARDSAARKDVGDRFLRGIEGDAGSSDLERLLAATTLNATRKPLYSLSSTLGTQRAAFDAVAAGVSGPCGPVIAALALKGMAAAYNSDDRRALAPVFLEAIAAHGQPAEQRLARVALDATSKPLYSGASAVAAHKQAFEQVLAGLSGTDEATVAGYGRAVMATAYNTDDRFALGGRVLDDLARGGSVIATVGANAACQRVYSRSSAVAVQDRALELTAGGGAPDAAMIALGQHALQHGYNSDDKALLGGNILEALAARTVDPTAAAVARATSKALGASLYSNASRVNMLGAAFVPLASPTPLPLEQALANLGSASHTAGYNAQDKALLGAAVLDELAARTADKRVKTQIAYARQSLTGDPASDVATQKTTFESVLSGRTTVSVALPGVGLSLEVPLIDEQTPDAEAKIQLDQCVPQNRQVMGSLTRMEQQQAAAIPALEADLQKAIDESAARGAHDPRAARDDVDRLQKLQGLAFVGAIGGFVGAVTAHMPVLAVVGAACSIASVMFSQRARAKAIEHGNTFSGHQDLEFKKMMAIAMLSDAKSKLATTRTALQKAEAIHKPLDDRYRVLEMTRFLQATNPDPDARVEMEEQFVTIGGLRVPRNTASPAA